MNETSTPPAMTATHPDAKRQGFSRLAWVVALVLALALGALWWDLGRSAAELRGEVARELAVAQAASAQATAKEVVLAGELREAQAKLALLETRQAESQSQQAELEALYRDLSPSRDELVLTEVEQVLALATQELALAGNVQAALTALQLADAKLARLDRPRLAPLRRALAADMDRLKAVPFVDVGGIAARLDQAIAGVDALPLARDERLPAAVPEVPPPPAAAWERFLRDAWTDVKGLVRIEVSDRPAAPLVAPPQQYFLRENLRLRLLSARIALYARNEAGFRADVKASEAWVKQYFDTRTKSVQALTVNLGQMAAIAMPSVMPELAQSQAAVRALRATQERIAPRPPERPAAAAK